MTERFYRDGWFAENKSGISYSICDPNVIPLPFTKQFAMEVNGVPCCANGPRSQSNTTTQTTSRENSRLLPPNRARLQFEEHRG